MSHSDANKLVSDALRAPLDVKAYMVGRRLRTMFPEKAVIQGEGASLDLSEFAAGGYCTVTERPRVFQHVWVSFQGLGESLGRNVANTWYDVVWQGHALQVIYMKWMAGYCTEVFCWIIAKSDAVAAEFYLRACEWAAEVRGEVLVFDNGYWHKDAALYAAIKDATLDNLVLPPRVKQEIQDDFAQFFASREIYEGHRIPWKRGVLLVGPPGNGKTHTVKALLNWLSVPCLYVKSFRAHHSTEQISIHEVFERARQTTPCILVLEDLDSLINDRNRSFFLNELDGFAANTGIVVLATSNHPERLDPALTNRPSRFDRKYHFDLPAAPERDTYLRAWNESLEARLRISDAAIAATVAATDGFSYAYLKELFLSSMMRWISGHAQTTMDAVVSEQIGMLREQMHAMIETAPLVTDLHDEDDEEE